MARTCPDGHPSASEDYCDVCGIAMTSGAGGGGSDPADEGEATAPDLAPVRGTTQECPNCSATNPADALFCEACGYDYTTGTMPRPVVPLLSLPTPGALSPPDPRRGSGAGEPDPVDPAPSVPSAPSALTPSPPATSSAPALAEPWVAEVWIDPDWYHDQGSADAMPSPGMPTVVVVRHASSLLGRASRSRGIAPEVDISGDPGVSRRHAQLTTDGTRWFVEDLGSANGTYVGAAAGGLPSSPIPTGQKREIASGEQIYLGAWTRIVIRPAAEGEV